MTDINELIFIGDFGLALDKIDDEIDKESDSLYWRRQKVRALIGLKQKDTAISELENIIIDAEIKNNKSVFEFFFLGYLYIQCHRFHEASLCLSKALNFEDKYYDQSIRILLCVIYVRTMKYFLVNNLLNTISDDTSLWIDGEMWSKKIFEEILSDNDNK